MVEQDNPEEVEALQPTQDPMIAALLEELAELSVAPAPGMPDTLRERRLTLLRQMEHRLASTGRVVALA
jgi:type VI protein secretion system component VasF